MKSSPFAFLSGTVEKFNQFLENRDQSQKSLIVGALFALVLLVDYLVLVRPVIYVFTQAAPELVTENEKLRALREDKGNHANIDKLWATTREKLAEADKQFIPQEEISSLLESLSKLAQASQVKIISLKPLETSAEGAELTKIPIHINAVAATHDLGKFISSLESGPVFFKVINLRITTNSSDERRHIVELSIETYAKNK